MMTKRNNLYLIVGESGSGKSAVVSRICLNTGLKQVASYTTRPPRHEGEEGHTFIDKETFDAIDRGMGFAAKTLYRGNYYGVTKDMLDDATFYVIDPPGVVDLLEKYHRKNLVVIYITASKKVRLERMLERGDDIKDAMLRLAYDKDHFKDAVAMADYIIPNNRDIADAVVDLSSIILKEERAPASFKKTIYFSHPYGGDPDNAKRASEILLNLINEFPQYHFISPLHAYQFAYDKMDYQDGLEYCLQLMEFADECWVYGKWRESVGCCEEVRRCQELGLPLYIQEGE